MKDVIGAIILSISFMMTSDLAQADDHINLPEDVDATDWALYEKLKMSARRNYNTEIDKARAKYRADYSKVIAEATSIQILNLIPGPLQEAPNGDTQFLIRPYGKWSKIHSDVILTGENMQDLRKMLCDLLVFHADSSGGAWCHEPDKAIRVFVGKEVIFETSFSWKCSNFFISYPDDRDGEASWVGFSKIHEVQGFMDSLFLDKKKQ